MGKMVMMTMAMLAMIRSFVVAQPGREGGEEQVTGVGQISLLLLLPSLSTLQVDVCGQSYRRSMIIKLSF